MAEKTSLNIFSERVQLALLFGYRLQFFRSIDRVGLPPMQGLLGRFLFAAKCLHCLLNLSRCVIGGGGNSIRTSRIHTRHLLVYFGNQWKNRPSHKRIQLLRRNIFYESNRRRRSRLGNKWVEIQRAYFGGNQTFFHWIWGNCR